VNGDSLTVEIVYAAPQRAIVKTLRLPCGAVVADALQAAARDPAFDGVDLAEGAIGIFGVVTHAQHVLDEGDRIEIYRPLAADPKAARRERVKQARRLAR
jgi:putative ubiquitin-RnfH superfamily antitoxin RatB of RatAB toxin-antitoxin module